MKMLAPSILSADFGNLERDARLASESGAEFLHIDVMDGHFVPNISFGAIVPRWLAKTDIADFDIHLMIENPDAYLEDFVTERTKYITVHQEACRHLDRTLSHIHDLGVKAGVSINPATPVESLSEILGVVDLVLVMSVNPGFGGQSFIMYTLDKIKKLADIRRERGLDFLIEVDGGVKLGNVKEVIDAGADIIVAGSAVFGNDYNKIGENVKAFKEMLR